jgi:hypothetical protein
MLVLQGSVAAELEPRSQAVEQGWATVRAWATVVGRPGGGLSVLVGLRTGLPCGGSSIACGSFWGGRRGTYTVPQSGGCGCLLAVPLGGGSDGGGGEDHVGEVVAGRGEGFGVRVCS